MRKANATIYAAAALGLCLMSPQGAAASPAMPDMGKTYTQAAKGENLVLARFVRGRAVGVGRVGRFGAVGVRHYGLGRGLGYGDGRRAYLGRPWLARWLLWPRTRFGLRLRPPRLLGRGRRLLWRMGSRIRSWPGLGLASWPRARAGRSRDGLGLGWGLGLSLLLRWRLPGLLRWRRLLLVGAEPDPAAAFASGKKRAAKHSAVSFPRKRGSMPARSTCCCICLPWVLATRGRRSGELAGRCAAFTAIKGPSNGPF